jgi:hypothetical protein
MEFKTPQGLGEKPDPRDSISRESSSDFKFGGSFTGSGVFIHVKPRALLAHSFRWPIITAGQPKCPPSSRYLEPFCGPSIKLTPPHRLIRSQSACAMCNDQLFCCGMSEISCCDLVSARDGENRNHMECWHVTESSPGVRLRKACKIA